MKKTKITKPNSEDEFYNDSDNEPVDNSEDDGQWNFD